MSKKKRTKRSGHPGRARHLSLVGQPPSADTALQLRFNVWYRQHAVGYDDHPDPESVRALTTLLFELAASNGFSLGQPTIPVIDRLLSFVDDNEKLIQLSAPILNTLDHYLEFLGETGLWAGTDDEYAASTDLILALLEGPDEAGPETLLAELLEGLENLPDVPVREQLAALDAMTPVAAAADLLDWIGTGRPATSTGAVRLADVEPVAALLGINAVGKRGASRPVRGIFDDEDDYAIGSEPIPVGTMWDLPELERWWSALAVTGVIDMTPTRLHKGPRSEAWNSPDTARAVGIRTEFLGYYLEEWFGPTPAAFLPSLVPYALLHGLAQLSAATNPAVHPEMSSEALLVEMCATAPPSTGPLDLGRFAALTTERSLRHLRDMRMLSARPAPDGHDRYVVAEGARPAFAAGIRPLRLLFTSFAGLGPGSTGLAGSAQTLGSAHPPGTVLRLKIALLESKPAIWRRVTVSADATFADLHHIIQAVFGWEDSHLHQFFEGDEWYAPGVVFADLRFQEFFEEEIEDEAAIALGVFFEEPGDEFNYLYDFGDDWRHVIRLEAVEPAGTDAAPHCIDGRGHPPVDDSGGVFGWADKVHISRDPSEPDYDDIRDWLGLAPGEVLDPAWFDVAEADAALAPLRDTSRG